MNQWAINRKRVILGIALGVIVLIIGIPTYLFFNISPTCSDSKQNGDESGVDCGGSCKLICSNETLPLIMKGDPRVLKVATSTYEVVVTVENPNVSGQVFLAPYTINIYGADSAVPLKVIQAQTFIPKHSTFGIFQGPFNLGSAVPVRATFVWGEGSFVWEKNLNPVPELDIKDGALSNLDKTPRLEATLSSAFLSKVANIELVALVSDQNGNIISASKTFVDVLNPGEVVPIVFSWPNPFVGQATTFEIIPRILPDKSFI